LIFVPGASLSAGKNYEKAQLPAFSKIKFFLAVGEPPRRFKRLRGLPMTCLSRRSLRAFHCNQQDENNNIGL